MPKLTVSPFFKAAVDRISGRTQLSHSEVTDTLGRHLLSVSDKRIDGAYGVRHRKRLHRKGQLEIFLFLIIVFVIGVIALFLVPVFDVEHNAMVGIFRISTINASLSDDAETASLNIINSQVTFVDILVVGIALSLTIASVWVSSRIHSLPIFVGLVLFWLIISAALSILFSNVWGELTSGSLSDYASRLFLTNKLFTYFWGYALISVVLSSIVFYAGRAGAGQETIG